MPNISNVEDVYLEADSNGNTTGLNFVNNIRFDLNTKKAVEVEENKTVVFSNRTYFTSSRIYLVERGYVNGNYWQDRDYYFVKYYSVSSNSNVKRATVVKLNKSYYKIVFSDGDVVLFDGISGNGIIALGDNIKMLNATNDNISKFATHNRFYMIIGNELICCDAVNDVISTYSLDSDNYKLSLYAVDSNDVLCLTSSEKSLVLNVSNLNSIEVYFSFPGEIAWY